MTPLERAARRGDLLPHLLRVALEERELEDGYRFRFDGGEGTLPAILRALAQERQCCRFLRFRLTLEPDVGPIHLEVTGPPGTRLFLDVLPHPIDIPHGR